MNQLLDAIRVFVPELWLGVGAGYRILAKGIDTHLLLGSKSKLT